MKIGKHRREEPTADGPAAAQSELVDRSWEAYDAELVGSRSFSGMTRRLPFLFGYFARIAWESGRVNCVSMTVADLISGLMSALALLGTTQVLTALLASAPTLGRVKAALPALLFILGVTIVRTLVTLIAQWNEDRLMPNVSRTVERRLYAATTQVELAAFDTPGFYDSLQRARGRGQSEAAKVVQLAVSMLTGMVTLVSATVVLGTLSPLLVPLTLVAALPDAWAALRSARMRYQVSYELGVCRRRKLILADLMADRWAAAEVRSFNMRDFLLRSYDVLASYERSVRLRLARRQSLVRLAGDAAGGTGLCIVYLMLGVLVTTGWIGLPEAGTAVLSIQLAVSALSGLLVTANQCYESGLYANDYLDFCKQAERTPTTNTTTPAAPLPAPEGFSVIRASGVSFTYPGMDKPALTDVSIEIHRGEVVALVGENGSGKSTLAKLLGGLYEPGSGEISWDGRSIAGMDREELRDRIAVIMQDYTRWPMTALENITMGRPRDDRLLATATAAAGTDRVIDSLPDGYDTPLDRRFRGGIEPSGGQWQRIAAARGLYRDGDLLICDEPTAALDARAEHAMFEVIRGHAAGSTVLLITHRLASVRHADRIYVLDHGRVVEHGDHDTLLADGGLYADLYTLQASAYAPV
jgi:ATP-binding cassette subfamily B protein/ATP-binding cassette subfamily C protein